MSVVLAKRPEVGRGSGCNREIRRSPNRRATRHRGGDARQSRRVPLGRWLLIVVLVAAAGAGGAWYKYVRPLTGRKDAAGRRRRRRERRASRQGHAGLSSIRPPRPAAAPPRALELIPVEVVPRCDVLRLTGTLVADERSSVASNTSGIAAEVRVDRGSLVRKNDVLVQIDPTDAKNKLAEGQAMLDELKARLGIDENTREFNPEDEPEVRLAKASADLAAVEPQAGQGPVRQESHLDRGVRSDADGIRIGRAAVSPGVVPDPPGVSGVQDGPDQAGDFGEGGGRHDDPRPVRRLGGREAGGRRRADFLRHAGHEGGHAGADRPACGCR